MMTEFISKEDFKRFFTMCPKLAWLFRNLENFKQGIKWKKEHILEYFSKYKFESDDELDVTPSIDPINDYLHYLEGENLTPEEIEMKEKIESMFEGEDGFEFDRILPETIIDGNLFGEAVRNYFKAEVVKKSKKDNIEYNFVDFQAYSFNNCLEESKVALLDKTNYALFEPSFSLYDGNLRVRCDVLINKGDRHVEIYEVKATSKPKPEHVFDLMYQVYTLKKLGYIVDGAYLIGVNSNFTRNGVGDFDLKDQLEAFKDIDLKEDILDFEKDVKPILEKNIELKYEEPEDINYEHLINIMDRYETKSGKSIMSFLEVIELIDSDFGMTNLFKEVHAWFGFKEEKEILNLMLDDRCSKYSFPIKKGLAVKSECCSHALRWFDKEELTIFDFNGVKKAQAADFYFKTNKIYISEINDINDPTFPRNSSGTVLTKTAPNFFKIMKKYLNNNKTIDWKDCIVPGNDAIFAEIASDYYKYPVYMYDFETSKWAVPIYNNQTPYMQTPFQYSIDILLDDNYDFNKPETMEHYDFLATENEDPRIKFIQKFVKDAFVKGPGVYVAYNKSFEKMVLTQLAFYFPEYRKPLLYIAQNTIDLMDFFKKPKTAGLIYSPKFKGSFSIKVTQPNLDSSLSYKDLRVNKGDKASQMFRNFIDGSIEEQNWKEIYSNDMLKYCNRDTLAMVVVLQRVFEILNRYNENILIEAKGMANNG